LEKGIFWDLQGADVLLQTHRSPEVSAKVKAGLPQPGAKDLQDQALRDGSPAFNRRYGKCPGAGLPGSPITLAMAISAVQGSTTLGHRGDAF
jgi:hypothetical protein